jgi:RNA polymerase sigma-70 factor (ECF subfamily)
MGFLHFLSTFVHGGRGNMSDTSSSLIRRVRDRADAQSWREFVALYEPLLLGYVRSRGIGEDDAGDLVQDIFSRLVRALPRFELDHARGRFRTYLYQVAMNALKDWWAQAGRRDAAEEEWGRRWGEGPTPGPDEEPEWLVRYHRRVLEFALERVRARTRPVTWACFQEHLLRGRPVAEVAAEMGITTNTLYVNASRVLKKVREQCADYLEELGDDPSRLPGGP